MLALLICLFKPLKVYDAPHMLSKFSKYNELIDWKRRVSFKPAQSVQICRNATASHVQPSLLPYEWDDLDASIPLPFNYTHYEWFAFKGTLELPDGYDASQHLLRMTFVVDRKYLVREYDDDFPAGPEGRMWLNDRELAALDEFHDGASVREEDIVSGGRHEVRMFTGRCESSHTLSEYGLAAVHKDTEAMYQRLRFLIDLIKHLPSACEQLPRLLTVIDEAVRMLDIRETTRPIELEDVRQHDSSSEAFYASVGPALRKLKEGLAAMPRANGNEPTVGILGYSHIDTMWMWPFNITRFKTVNTATSMLHLMENPPHEFEENPLPWQFLATAPQHYKWMNEDAKDVWTRVLQAAKKGRWDVNGVMWLEPDTTLPSGEGLVKQILYGTRYFYREMGEEFKQTVLFLPDCFGFTGALPQILKLANVTGFVTSKISWSEYTIFPYSTFQWRGIDGTIVPAHFLTTPVSWGTAATYTGTVTPFEIIGTWETYKQKDVIRYSTLHSAGYGDGGGGVTEEMVWNMHLFDELPKLEGVPRVSFPNLTGVFEEIVDKQEFLPVWDDELYLEYHRGTLTSFEEIKRQNRQLEAHLHNVEWLMTMYNAITGDNVSSFKERIDPIWEFTCLQHFHDCIPGSSINEANLQVIHNGAPHLAELRVLEAQLSEKIASSIVVKSDRPLIINTLSHARMIGGQKIPSGGWARQNPETIIETDETRTEIYMRTFNNSYEMHEIYQPFISTVHTGINDNDVVIDASRSEVKTPFLILKFDSNGNFESVTDRATGLEYLDGPGNVFELYEDRPISWSAWDIQRYHKEMPLPPLVLDKIVFDTERNVVTRTYHIERVGDGPAGTSTVTQNLTFSSASPFVECHTVVNWTQHDKLLKIAVPTTIRAKQARFGIQFGNLQRPTHNNTDRDMARFESSGRWADLSDETRGVSILSDIKAGHDVHDNVIRLSLLKAPLQVDRWEDFGVRKFSYRLMFHNTSFVDAKVPQLHDDMVYPVVVASPVNDSIGRVDSTHAFVTITNDHVIMETMKIAEDEDGFICRFYESAGGTQHTQVIFPLLESSQWNSPVVVSLLEEKLYDLEMNAESAVSFELTLKPFQILSVLISRKKAE